MSFPHQHHQDPQPTYFQQHNPDSSYPPQQTLPPNYPQQQQPPTYPHSTNPVTQFPHSASAFANPPPEAPPPQRADDPQFDIFEWHPKYQSCQRYFLDHAQHSGPVQAVSAFLNIHLPFQRSPPLSTSTPRPFPSPTSAFPTAGSSHSQSHHLPTHVSLVPYLRRLVVTGLDFPGVLHGFFGDDWVPGVGPLHEQERRNYLFAAKSGGWASVKRDYDMLPLETVPFFRPLQGAVDAEIAAAEKSWSEWLAMEDWMVGPRAPERMGEGRRGGGGSGGSGAEVKREGMP